MSGGGGRSSGGAVSRGGSSGSGSRSSGGSSGGHVSHGDAQRGPGSSSGTPHSAASGSGQTGDRAVARGSEGGRDSAGGSAVPEFARPSNGRPTIGHAVPRTGNAPGAGGGAIIVPGYYGGYFPWGFGGIGFAGYYGGYYDPFGGWGDPYYGGFDDQGGGFGQPSRSYDEGALRLKLKPRGASVYVDGSYAGVVDDFDGIFQKLHLDAGSHRVEVQMPGYETLAFEVRIEPNHTTTYHGDLTKVP
jgi:hypothetical protein